MPPDEASTPPAAPLVPAEARKRCRIDLYCESSQRRARRVREIWLCVPVCCWRECLARDLATPPTGVSTGKRCSLRWHQFRR